MKPIRVLTLIDGFRMGGAEMLLAPLAVAIRNTNIEMDIVGLDDSSVNAEKTMTILSEAGVHPRSLGVRRLLDLSGVPRLVREIRSGDYDLVHAHLEMSASFAVPAAKLSGRPVVCTFHHVTQRWPGRAHWRERIAAEAATRGDRVLFVSEASRASWSEVHRGGRTPRNWDVLHNGIDVSNFRPDAPDPTVRNEIGGGPGPLVVLPAAFRDFKGIPVAIQAWPLVLQKHPNAILSLVGGGPDEAEFRKLVSEAGLIDSVIFAGVRSDMPQVYRAADLVLLPSTFGENLPTVLIEASASGSAIAASKIGGIPDIVIDGDTGLLFEANDPAALAATVTRLLESPELRTTLGGQAVERARTKFSSASWARRLHDLYVELNQRKR
ncbi:glycosyltransferase family 4 protein [Mycobacterium sp. CBMA293]|uniref:glycosyltransferase family 4 protein n=2 Tax=Mycolicibacterium TaxID=1866885 RepID=UPI0012DE2405|nr:MULTISPECIES: glycosyltransferase family 4 protein [unclassified Mycolicibacterium]MUL45449.1 glycosyltransferase family 4 protein [Mycolicibacterium sp. CBMA 360]MUL56970.1 glycosyltransferase family 4 protein [Mycolicibacterium sp. CBMA 335]MUL70010.1 glycosyltransferase family 4 protein [Mycolicibacterium sp. CBMA 311]MUL92058.1 glycosyltransferase family 4 protein [Mycolicibacterium sp. CBMA 230]MUM05797.1 glycosyl transferase family 1 [Mycolicibacterium sp. CBMA 213]